MFCADAAHTWMCEVEDIFQAHTIALMVFDTLQHQLAGAQPFHPITQRRNLGASKTGIAALSAFEVTHCVDVIQIAKRMIAGTNQRLQCFTCGSTYSRIVVIQQNGADKDQRVMLLGNSPSINVANRLQCPFRVQSHQHPHIHEIAAEQLFLAGVVRICRTHHQELEDARLLFHLIDIATRVIANLTAINWDLHWRNSAHALHTTSKLSHVSFPFKLRRIQIILSVKNTIGSSLLFQKQFVKYCVDLLKKRG